MFANLFEDKKQQEIEIPADGICVSEQSIASDNKDASRNSSVAIRGSKACSNGCGFGARFRHSPRP